MTLQTLERVDARAKALHQRAVVFDALTSAKIDRAYMERAHEAGVTCTVPTIAVNDDFRGAVGQISDWWRKLEDWKDLAFWGKSVADIYKAKREGRIAVFPNFQNSQPIERDIRLIQVFYVLGIRTIQLTYNDRNYVGDGCLERTGSGLSDFGIAVVREMNRLGMVVDVSHSGEGTARDAIAFSSDPIIYSHANCRALCDVERNVSDDTIKQLAERGGVIGINTFGPHVTTVSPKTATLDQMLDHVDHVRSLVGVDHVGIGLDLCEGKKLEDHLTDTGEWGVGTKRFGLSVFKGASYPGEYSDDNWPEGIQSVAEFPNITAGLLRRGYSEEEVEKVISGNFLRVYAQVFREA